MRTCYPSSRLVSGTLGIQSGQGSLHVSSVLVSAISAAEYMYIPVTSPPAKNRTIPFHTILTFWAFVIILSSW